MKPALFSVLCEIKEKTGQWIHFLVFSISIVSVSVSITRESKYLLSLVSLSGPADLSIPTVTLVF